MGTYCLKCKRITKNIDPKMCITKNNRLLMQSKCSDCEVKIRKRSRSKGFIK